MIGKWFRSGTKVASIACVALGFGLLPTQAFADTPPTASSSSTPSSSYTPPTGNVTLMAPDGSTSTVVESGSRGQGTFKDINYGFGSTTSTAAPDMGTPTASVSSSASVVGLANASLNGYWLAATDGGVFAFNAPFYGSAGGVNLSAPITAITPTPSRGGYWASVNASLGTSQAAQIGRTMLPQENWGTISEWNALNTPWGSDESGWRYNAANTAASCGGGNYAYGIPQSCPGSKMSNSGPALPNWQTDAWTQIVWGYWYIAGNNSDYLNGQHVTDPISALNYENRCGYPCGYSPTA